MMKKNPVLGGFCITIGTAQQREYLIFEIAAKQI